MNVWSLGNRKVYKVGKFEKCFPERWTMRGFIVFLLNKNIMFTRKIDHERFDYVPLKSKHDIKL